MKTPEMLQCHEVIAQLWAYIDRELTPELTSQVHAHLEICERCYPQYNFHRAFVAFVRKAETAKVPAALRRSVFQRLLTEDTGGSVA